MKRLILFTICVFVSHLAISQTRTWTGASNTAWNNATNWSPTGIPTATDDVTIPSAPTNQPTISVNTVVAKSVEVQSGATLTISASGQLTINDFNSFTVVSSIGNAAFLNRGTVENNGKLILGNTGTLSTYGLWNVNMFNNNTGSEITIDRTTFSGLFNGSGTFTNLGKITAGANESTGLNGVRNQATFNNNTGGEITIDRSTNSGLENDLGTFTNLGKITIGASNGVGPIGVYNSGTFNNSGGEITIDRSTNSGLVNDVGTLTNLGKITVGASNRVGPYGVNNGGTFNNLGGEINIDSSSNSGLYNLSGTFTNNSKITIGANTGVGLYGVFNRSTFNNNTTGEISIDRSTTVGLVNFNYANSFTNAGKVIIGANANVGNNAIKNYEPFVNSNCGIIVAKRGSIDIVSSGTYTNNGFTFVAGELKNSGAFSNDGVLKYGSTSGNAIANATNPSVIINDDPTPILTYGGSYNGTVNGIFTDTTLIASAGTFVAPNTFTPSGSLTAGSQTLYASITQNNCANAVSVPFTFNYVPPTPEINLKGNNVSIVSGATTTSVSDSTGFGSLALDGESNTNTFWIINDGPAELTLGADPVTKTGANEADFILVQPTVTSIAAGDSVSFQITFDPSVPGLKAATISIANNDSDENPYTFAVSGAGTSLALITAYADNTEFAEVTQSFNSIDIGISSRPVFTDLDGDGLLDLLVGEFDGTLHHYEQDALNSTSFTRRTQNFNGIDVGDDSAPAFTDIDGDGLLDLFIGEENGNLNYYEQNALNSTSFTRITQNFNGIDVGIASVPVFTDLNGDGLLDLFVGKSFGRLNHYEQNALNSTSFTLRTEYFDGIDVAFDSGPAFTDLDGDGLLDLLIGEFFGKLNHYKQNALISTSFTQITQNFNGIDVGDDSAPAFTDIDGDGLLDLLVGEDSGNLNHYEKTQGVIPAFVAPENVASGTAIVSIHGKHLTGDITVTAPNDFEVSLNLAGPFTASVSVSPTSGSVLLDSVYVRLKAVPAGAYSGDLTVSSANSNSFTFPLSGTVTAPEIDVKGNSVSIVSGTTTTSVSNSTDFGSLALDGESNTNTFWIINDGPAELTLGADPVSKTGANEADFILVQPTVTSIAAGDSVSFQITFDPSVPGLKAATISIANNDSDENPYTFAVSGTGTSLPLITAYTANSQFEEITQSFSSIDVENTSKPVFTDLDGDGLLDLLVGEFDGRLHHYEQDALNSTSFTLRTQTFNGIDVGGYSAPVFTDLDADGLLDLLVGESGGKLYHYEQDALNSTSFTLRTQTFNGIDVGGLSAPSFTDIDGDGLLDLLIGEFGGNLNRYEQNPMNSTSFTLRTQNFNGIDVGISSAPVFTDLNGDGLLDLLVGEAETLNHYEQDAVNSTSFTRITRDFNGIDVGNASVPVFTDLDADGLLDLLVGEATGELNHYEQTQGVIPAFVAPENVASDTVIVSIHGKHLTGDITVTAPNDFEVSLNPAGPFTASVSVSPTSGSVLLDSVYVRLKAMPVGTYSGNLTVSSTGSNSFTFPLSGTVTAPEIDVKGNNVSIVSGATNTSVSDSTDFGSINVSWGATPIPS